MVKSPFFAIFIVSVLSIASCNLYGEDLDNILQQHVEAVGGIGVINHVNSTVTFHSIVFGGLSGTQVIHYKAPFKVHLFIDYGIITQELGFDGKISWTIDPNGMVRQDISEEIKPLINELYFASFSYALPYGHPGRREFRGDTTIGDNIYYKVALLPDGGDSVVIFINKQTGLVDYRGEFISGLRMVTEYSDYREVEGLQIPFRAVANSPDGPLQISSQLDSIWLNADIPDAIFKMPGDSMVDYRFPATARSIDIPIEMYRGYLGVRIRINGTGPFFFLLDTGASMTLMSKTAANSLGLNISGNVPMRGIGGFGSVGFVEIDSIGIGVLPFYLKRVLVYDFNNMSGMLGMRIDGILGYDFFARFPMKINNKADRITIYNPEYPLPEFEGNEIKLEIFSQVPVIEAEINGEKVRLLLDLGAQPGLVLRAGKKPYQMMEELAGDSLQDISIAGIGGMNTVGQGKVESLKIGDYLFNQQLTVIIDDFSQLPFSDYIDGILGLGILGDFDMVLDYPSRSLYLYKNK